MTGALENRPHREAGTPPRVPMRPSRFLLGALGAFVAVAGAAVFKTVFARFGLLHATVASLACVAGLALAAVRWTRRQPVAIGLHADGLTVWERAGTSQYRRIVGCAQWGGRLLTLSLSSEKGGAQTLVVAADCLDPDTFRQLCVRARRAAGAYL
ncbi:protein YgfX [Caballeronia sp. Lep1P3]|uniref:protein YgfX n=1 Tax=Caballeronia sp. Lep1P3 TaxID=2878150 RepID=UPI001FD3DA0C|nr:protein YgfX [Caballeronia sp. Lep1P3]